VVCKSSSQFDFQKALKEFDDFSDRMRVAGKRFRYVHKASRVLILDSYLRGELALFFHVQPAFKLDDVRGNLKISGGAVSRPSFAVLVNHANAVNMSSRKNGEKQPMFVSYVKNVNGPNSLVPSIARLYRVDHQTEEIGAGSVYLSLHKRTFKLIDGLAHGKFRPITDESGKQLFDGLEPSIVEGAIKIVDGIAEHQSYFTESGRIAEIVNENFATSFRINLDSRMASFVKRDDAIFDIEDVLIGPVNFEP
jgi:hypothetical protein